MGSVQHCEQGEASPNGAIAEHDPHDELTIELPVKFVHELSMAETLHDILTTVAKWSRTVFRAERASITLAGDGDPPDHLKLIALEGNDAIPVDVTLPTRGTMVGRVFVNKRSEICPDFDRTEDLDCIMLRSKGLQSCLDVPLVSGWKCFGTINIADARRHAFSEVDRRKLEAMAHWVAASIRIHHQMEEMVLLSETDPLTGTFNRRAFGSRFAQMAKRWGSRGVPLGIALVDLDHFKTINDTHGHEAGDKALVHVSKLLLRNCRKSDLVARMGGEEFCVAMSDIDKDGMMSMLTRFSEALNDSELEHNGQSIKVTASIGAILIEGCTRDLDFLIGQADKAMYRAKDAGRNRIEFDHIC